MVVVLVVRWAVVDAVEINCEVEHLSRDREDIKKIQICSNWKKCSKRGEKKPPRTIREVTKC